ncbi:MAG: response regulator [Rubrivivax sp.]|nr:MAG: response regulator [Rubrivivax sp.]
MGKRVLVVDDHHDTVEILEQYLAMEGHEVASATTPEHALAIAEEFQPEIVILDISMPNIDGYELASHLRFKVEGSCVFIAATGHGSQSHVAQSQRAGFKAHLTKPVDMSRLLAELA